MGVTVGKKAAARLDGWQNEITGLGVYERDKRMRAVPRAVDKLSDSDLHNLYDGDGLAKKVIVKPIRAMLRGGWEVTGLSEDQTKALAKKAKEIDLANKLRQALIWDQWYGGAIIFIGADDGQDDLEKPLRFESVKDIRFLEVIARPWVRIVSYNQDAKSPNFGKPEMFTVTPIAPVGSAQTHRNIHASRCVYLPGPSVSDQLRANQAGWSISALSPIIEAVRDYSTAFSGTSVLVADFGQAVFKMRDLSAILSQKQGSAVRTRLELMDLSRSIINALIIDADGGEDFERKSTPVGGLPELLDRIELYMCAASDIPATVLIGRSPSGMGATGKSELENWYNRLEESRTECAVPAIEQMTAILLQALGIKKDDWTIKFAPLWQMSEQEEADLHKKQSESDATNILNKILSPKEVRESRFGGEEYSIHTVLIAGEEPELELEQSPEPEEPPEVA